MNENPSLFGLCFKDKALGMFPPRSMRRYFSRPKTSLSSEGPILFLGATFMEDGRSAGCNLKNCTARHLQVFHTRAKKK